MQHDKIDRFFARLFMYLNVTYQYMLLLSSIQKRNLSVANQLCIKPYNQRANMFQSLSKTVSVNDF